MGTTVNAYEKKKGGGRVSFIRVFAVVACVLFTTPQAAQAALYAPGTTLDPACAPTDSNCGIAAVVASGMATNVPYYAATGSTLSATSSLTILPSGNIGMGTLAPDAKLTVNGAPPAPTGSELITNGTFTGSAAGWGLGSNVVYGTNNIISTYAGGDASASTTFATVNGDWYSLTFTVSNANAPVYFYLYPSGYYNYTNFINGTYTLYFQADSTGTVKITFDDSYYRTGDTWTLDTVSIKQTALPASTLKIVGGDGSTWLSLYTGNSNVALGKDALQSNTTGYDNTANGYQALALNTTGSNNTANGYQALYYNTTGSFNTASGDSALAFNTTGNNNAANGYQALYYNTTGSYNTANGYQALSSNTTGYGNTANGASALYYNTTGRQNTASGFSALQANTTGNSNIAIGWNALYYNTTGSYNTASGGSALQANTTGNNNTVLGYLAGYGISTGNNNIIIGAIPTATSYLATGSGNIVIGTEMSIASSTISNSLDIGNLIYGTGLDGFGATLSTGNVGIGTTTPLSRLAVSGNASVGADYNVAAPANGLIVEGKVGIGTTSPDLLLSVGSATPVGNVAHFENSTGSCYINPTTTALVCSSDSRLKTNFNAMSTTTALAGIDALAPTFYNWKTEATGTPEHAGFIAQQVQPVFPDLVATEPDGFLTMNYAGLTPYLASAVQALDQRTSLMQDVLAISGSFKDALAAWLGTATNGIGKIFAAVVEGGTLRADAQLCIGSTCVTEPELKALLQKNGQTITGGSGSQALHAIPESLTSTSTPPAAVASTSPGTSSTDASTTPETVAPVNDAGSLSAVASSADATSTDSASTTKSN
ncbi:MAG: tail fiber domain-containing protein [Minisyncoccota bacterium]